MAIMEHFAQALALVIVSHRSLAAAEPSTEVWNEEETLRRAIKLLNNVYDEIDAASIAMKNKRPPAGRQPDRKSNHPTPT